MTSTSASTRTASPTHHYDNNGSDQGPIDSNDIVRVPINTTKLSQQEQLSSLSSHDLPPPYTATATSHNANPSASTATAKPRRTSLFSAHSLSAKVKGTFRSRETEANSSESSSSSSSNENNDHVLLLPMRYGDYVKYWRKKPSLDGVVENDEYAEDVVEPRCGRLEWVRRQMEEEWVLEMVERRERRLKEEKEDDEAAGRGGKKEKVRYKVAPLAFLGVPGVPGR